MRPTEPSHAGRLPLAIIAILAVIALILVVVAVLSGIDSILRRNGMPSITVSAVPVEGGCLNGTPNVTFQVTLSNAAFGDGTAHVSFYQDNTLLGTEQWFVPARDRTHSESVSYAISSCGGHTYTYHLDSVTQVQTGNVPAPREMGVDGE
jgi:hypothetical protein